MANRVIMLEFNELVPTLINRFIGQGQLPGFERLRRESMAAVTHAEAAGDWLEPWVQWVTVHSGIPHTRHKAFRLGEGARLGIPRVWDRVSDAGRTVWVCGSMNAEVESKAIRGMVLPDPWSVGLPPIPEELFAPYYHFVRTYVQEYTRDKPPLTKGDYLAFVRFMLSNGISRKTLSDTVNQLVGERTGLPRWRRACILDRISGTSSGTITGADTPRSPPFS